MFDKSMVREPENTGVISKERSEEPLISKPIRKDCQKHVILMLRYCSASRRHETSQSRATPFKSLFDTTSALVLLLIFGRQDKQTEHYIILHSYI